MEEAWWWSPTPCPCGAPGMWRVERRRRTTVGEQDEDRMRERGGQGEYRRRTGGGQEDDRMRARGGQDEYRRRTGGGHKEDKGRNEGGQEDDTTLPQTCSCSRHRTPR